MASSNRNRVMAFAGIVLAGVTSGLVLDWIRSRREKSSRLAVRR